MHHLFNTVGLVYRVYIFSVFKKQFIALQKTQHIFVCAENETNIPLLTQQILFRCISKNVICVGTCGWNVQVDIWRTKGNEQCNWKPADRNKAKRKISRI
jgi:hypothetical protein